MFIVIGVYSFLERFSDAELHAKNFIFRATKISAATGILKTIRPSLIRFSENVSKIFAGVIKLATSRDLLTIVFTGHALSPYSIIGRHSLLTNE